MERTYRDEEGRTWTFRRRPEVRQGEAATHVTLLVETPGAARVVSCLRAEWESDTTDLAALLARALPAGASRVVSGEQETPPDS